MYLIINSKGYKSVTKEIILQAEPFKGEHDKYHYCYEVYVPSTKWTYRGVRSHKDWSKDKYLGSSSYYSYKDDINVSKRVEFRILSFHPTRKEANDKEIEIVSKEYIDLLESYNMTLPKCTLFSYNMIPVKDKYGNTFIVNKCDKKYLDGTFKHVSTDLISVKDEFGNFYKIHKSDNRLNISLFPIAKDKVTVKTSDGKTLQVHKNDKRITNGKLVHISKGKVNVINKNGDIIKVDKSDPMLLEGHYQYMMKNKITVKDKYGNTMQVDKDDPRYISSELVGVMKGRWNWCKYITIENETKYAKDWAKEFNTTVGKLKAYLESNDIEYQI